MSYTRSLDDRLREYLLENGDNLSFAHHFWKDCEPLESDVKQYCKFVSVLESADAGVRRNQIAKDFGVHPSTVYTWVKLLQMPKLTHYLKTFLMLGVPRTGWVWLTLETSHGYGIPIGQFIQVPTRISAWPDVREVTDQIQPIEPVPVGYDRIYLFGFFLGMMIGDAAKSKPKGSNQHRHVGLVLSKKYETNLNLGEFTCLCAHSIGLRMHRTADLTGRNKPHGFYEWVSQSSALLDWLHVVALGLKESKVATSNPIQADWIINAPLEFRTGLVQGLAESDGSVNVSAQEVEFWVGPNWTLMNKFLSTFNLRSFRSRQATALAKQEAVKAFHVPIFSPTLKSVRYQRLEKLALAKKLAPGGERLPPQLRAEIRGLKASGVSTSKIIEAILDKYGLIISFEAAERWGRLRATMDVKGETRR